jgi:hypothetical protein
MRISDLALLARKIAVGVVITVVPLGIVTGALLLTKRIAITNTGSAVTGAKEASHAN